jgi:probable F420-dependent oxidoreductase
MHAYEHILGAEKKSYPDQSFLYTHEHSFREPFVMYAYLAGLTSHLEFVTGILVLPQRDVRLVAKQAAELSMLSAGRFRLGVGGGWNRAEFEALGVNFSKRGRIMDEQLQLLRKLWTEPLVDFEGEFHQLRRCGLNPLPPSPPPIYLGGWADPVLRRAARYADGWLPATLPEYGAGPLVEKLHAYLKEEGRDPSSFGIDARVVPLREPEECWATAIANWRSLGATHIRCQTLGHGFTTPDQHLQLLERFLKVARG